MSEKYYEIDGVGRTLMWFDPTAFDDEEVQTLGRLLAWQYDPGKKAYRVRRKAPHRVGRLKFRNRVLSVVPDFTTTNFAALFLYAEGVDLKRFMSNDSAAVAAQRSGRAEHFEVLVASLLCTACEHLASGYLARTYERRTERLQAIRGRVDWMRSAAAPAHLGPWCAYELITSDNLLNRLILAGLMTAGRMELPAPLAQRRSQLEFSWRAICSVQAVSVVDLDYAERGLTRLTEAYRAPLALCRMLLFGFMPADLHRQGNARLQLLEFDIAALFERFVLRLITDSLANTPLSVAFQDSKAPSLLNGVGSIYKKTRPDFVLIKQGRPHLVLDAKYKPRYVEQNGAKPITSRNKLDESDIYQMLFYLGRLPQGSSNEAIVVAPRIDQAAGRIAEHERIVIWSSPGDRDRSIRILELDLVGRLDALSRGTPQPHDEFSAWLNTTAQSAAAPRLGSSMLVSSPLTSSPMADLR